MPDSNVVLYPGELLLPADRSSLTEWACVACDQFTSQPRYWEDVRRFVGNHPSTLDLILPECYLNEAPQRIERIHRAMRDDLEKGVLVPAVSNGFILVERNTSSGARVGLVALLDLECYDPAKGSKSLVRASEETIAERVPPRMTVRRGAALETSHVLMLMDDPMHSVIEPLFQKHDELDCLYDFPLMMGGGHLTDLGELLLRQGHTGRADLGDPPGELILCHNLQALWFGVGEVPAHAAVEVDVGETGDHIAAGGVIGLPVRAGAREQAAVKADVPLDKALLQVEHLSAGYPHTVTPASTSL